MAVAGVQQIQGNPNGEPVPVTGGASGTTTNLVGINGVAPSQSNPLPVTQAIPQADYSLACSANLTDATFPSLVPTTTTPAASATRAVFAVPSGHDNVVVTPFGVGSNNTTFSMRLTGWQQSSSGLWIPTLIWTLTSCTLDTALPGVTSEVPDNTNFFCDALTLSAGIGVLNSTTSADSLIKNIAMDDIGSFDFLEITVDMTGATSANALYLTY